MNTQAQQIDQLNRKIYGDRYKDHLKPKHPNYFDTCQKMNTNNMEANLQAVSEYRDILFNLAVDGIKEYKKNKKR